MNLPKTTPWFINGEKPAYKGVYNVSCQRENQTGKYYSYWNGKKFNVFALTVDRAYSDGYSKYYGEDCVLTEGSWRGLAENPLERQNIHGQLEHFDLLKLAAKVVGYKIITIQHGKLCCTKDDKTTFHWNPATNDGDALRLAVERNVFTNAYFSSRVATELLKCHNLQEATRLAILHLAANGNKA